MQITEFAQRYKEKMFPGIPCGFMEPDPEFMARYSNFAYDEVLNQPGQGLDDKTRFMAILAALLGCQGIDFFRSMLKASLEFGVTPVEAKEIVYQAVAYLGMGRVLPFLRATNEIFTDLGISIPLEGQATTTMETRREAGNQVQVEIFGEQMRNFWESAPEESRHINVWLAENCFGDYYTRKGLDYRQREMITFCYLMAQGGCEPQLISHIEGNFNVGNDKAFLIRVISQCLPFIGYPRSLNALRCVNETAERMASQR